MAEVKLNTVLKTFTGESINDVDEEGSKTALTVKTVMLNSVAKPEPNLSGKEQTRRYSLSMRIYDADDSIILEAEDLALVKELIPKAYNAPIIVGQTLRLIDPPEEVKKKTEEKSEE